MGNRDRAAAVVANLPPASWAARFGHIRTLAQTGQTAELLAACRQSIDTHADDVTILLDVGALLLQFGFLGLARECFLRSRSLAPQLPGPLVNLANLEREYGNHTTASQLYAFLQTQLPQHPVIRRNALVGLEYNPEIPDATRLAQARAWGDWATARAGGPHPRPPMPPLDDRPLRVGYVSADFCQHPVGLFVKDILAAHDPALVTVFTYSAGPVSDWVTDAVRAASRFHDVTRLDDAALAEAIRQDAIDVLIDLSGHTAGSRLTAFAYRPAPVQLSWLGYFATTGLDCMDAVLLDPWHAPEGMETWFVEEILRLPMGRLCYQPVPWAPAVVAPPPCGRANQVTFGCFNNSAKLNDRVFDVWARILTALPTARLVLKWRTFNDAALCRRVHEAFAARGVEQTRVELRGPSFHAALLAEYADVDIALDPFPFTGGLTSCEALWMGVPVITWPQSRVVSRQTLAFLSAIGLPELAVDDAAGYVRLAVALAHAPDRLAALRSAMRSRMQASPLMDVSGFTRHFERLLRDYAQGVRPQNDQA